MQGSGNSRAEKCTKASNSSSQPSLCPTSTAAAEQEGEHDGVCSSKNHSSTGHLRSSTANKRLGEDLDVAGVEDPVERKKLQKLMKNRRIAADSRARARARQAELQDRLHRLEAENYHLRMRLEVQDQLQPVLLCTNQDTVPSQTGSLPHVPGGPCPSMSETSERHLIGDIPPAVKDPQRPSQLNPNALPRILKHRQQQHRQQQQAQQRVVVRVATPCVALPTAGASARAAPPMPSVPLADAASLPSVALPQSSREPNAILTQAGPPVPQGTEPGQQTVTVIGPSGAKFRLVPVTPALQASLAGQHSVFSLRALASPAGGAGSGTTASQVQKAMQAGLLPVYQDHQAPNAAADGSHGQGTQAAVQGMQGTRTVPMPTGSNTLPQQQAVTDRAPGQILTYIPSSAAEAATAVQRTTPPAAAAPALHPALLLQQVNGVPTVYPTQQQTRGTGGHPQPHHASGVGVHAYGAAARPLAGSAGLGRTAIAGTSIAGTRSSAGAADNTSLTGYQPPGSADTAGQFAGATYQGRPSPVQTITPQSAARRVEQEHTGASAQQIAPTAQPQERGRVYTGQQIAAPQPMHAAAANIQDQDSPFVRQWGGGPAMLTVVPGASQMPEPSRLRAAPVRVSHAHEQQQLMAGRPTPLTAQVSEPQTLHQPAAPIAQPRFWHRIEGVTGTMDPPTCHDAASRAAAASPAQGATGRLRLIRQQGAEDGMRLGSVPAHALSLVGGRVLVDGRVLMDSRVAVQELQGHGAQSVMMVPALQGPTQLPLMQSQGSGSQGPALVPQDRVMHIDAGQHPQQAGLQQSQLGRAQSSQDREGGAVVTPNLQHGMLLEYGNVSQSLGQAMDRTMDQDCLAPWMDTMEGPSEGFSMPFGSMTMELMEGLRPFDAHT